MSGRGRTWQSLRPQGPPPPTGERTIEDDIRDLFGSDMGQRVLAHLLEEAFGPCHEGAKDRALRLKEGERKFVARLRERACASG